MWNHLAESIVGTSHFVSGTPCQDAHEVHLLDEGENQLFAFAIADGAGSADYSGEAARLAVSSLIQEMSKPERDRFFVEEVVAREMFDLVRQNTNCTTCTDQRADKSNFLRLSINFSWKLHTIFVQRWIAYTELVWL